MLTRHLRAAARRGISSAGRAAPVNSCTASSGLQVVGQALVRPSIVSRAAPFHTSSAFRKGLMPDSDDPEPPNNEVPREPGHVLEPTPINDEEFNAMAMSYLEVVALRAETAHPHGSRLEVEPVVSLHFVIHLYHSASASRSHFSSYAPEPSLMCSLFLTRD